MDFSFQSILNRIRESFQNPVSRIEGTFSMDNAQAVSQELARIHAMEVTPIRDAVYLDTAIGEDLDRCGADLVELRHEAVCSVGTVDFTGAPGTIVPAGATVFSINLGFEITEDTEVSSAGVCTAPARCQTAGIVGNVLENEITSMRPTLPGVYSVSGSSAFSGGYDREGDEEYRSRLLDKRRKPFFSGNAYEYEMLAKQVPGVGYAKCIPCWAGVWTVKVVILSSLGEEPEDNLLQKVAEHIGKYRPPCAQVTVAKAVARDANLQITVALASGYGLPDVKADIVAALQKYILQINFSEKKYLSYYKLGDLLFEIDGVEDVTAYTINDAMLSLRANEEEFFRLQEVLVNGN